MFEYIQEMVDDFLPTTLTIVNVDHPVNAITTDLEQLEITFVEQGTIKELLINKLEAAKNLDNFLKFYGSKFVEHFISSVKEANRINKRAVIKVNNNYHCNGWVLYWNVEKKFIYIPHELYEHMVLAHNNTKFICNPDLLDYFWKLCVRPFVNLCNKPSLQIN